MTRQRWPVLLLVLLVMATGVRVARADDRRPRIWILPFQQLQADSSLAYLEEGLPALLAVAVSRSDAYALVDRQQVNQVLEEQSLTLEHLTSEDTRHRIGQLLGATVMISGSFVRQGSDVLIAMRATDLETGIITTTAEARGPARQPGTLVSQLYRRVAGQLGRRLPDLASHQIDDAPLSNLHFMKGLGHYHSARYSHALAEFMLAAEDATLMDIGRLWLARTYLAERQHAHAYLEPTRIRRGSVREDEVASLLRTCEAYLSAEDIKVIRELAGRQVPAEFSAGPALVTPRFDLREPIRVFGDHTVSVPLRIHVSRPDRLDVRAQLVQLTSSLSVAVSGELDVLPSTRADDRGAIEIDFSLTVPAVSRETDFELRFRSRIGDGMWQAAGRIAVRVYPADLLAPIRAWAQSHALRVEDDRGLLIQLFRRLQIPISDQSGGLAGVTLYAGPRALQKHANRPLQAGDAAVLFTERETDTPFVVVDRTGVGTIVRVETRLLDRLDTDPQAHKLLVEVFKHLHGQAAPGERLPFDSPESVARSGHHERGRERSSRMVRPARGERVFERRSAREWGWGPTSSDKGVDR